MRNKNWIIFSVLKRNRYKYFYCKINILGTIFQKNLMGPLRKKNKINSKMKKTIQKAKKIYLWSIQIPLFHKKISWNNKKL